VLLGRRYQHCLLYLKSNLPVLDSTFDPLLSFVLVESLLSLILGLLDASALFRNVAILISLSLALPMVSCLAILLMVDLTMCLTLRLTPLLSYVM
jgi:hypothetical protein